MAVGESAERQLSTPVRSKGVVTIPRPVREQLHLQEGDNLIVSVEDGRIVLTPAALLPRDQAWFWTPQWQQAEREADEQIIRDQGDNYGSGEAFLAALRERTATTNDNV
jgi:AbrB family looped-hinge helix DNA binding protein